MLRYNLFLLKRKHSRFTLGEFISWQQHLSILDPFVGRTVTPSLPSLAPSADRPTTDGPNKSCPLAPPDARPLPPTRTPPTPTLPPNKHPSSHSLSPLHSLPMAPPSLPSYPGQNTLRKGGERGVEREFCCHLLARTQAAKEGCEKKEEGAFLASFPCHLF